MEAGIFRREEQAAIQLRRLYQSCGYASYKMSRFEEYDFYLRNKDFLVSDRMIPFSGPDGRLMALKPDVTLSIVKNAPEAPGEVARLCYDERVYRDYREVYQTGLECVGDLGEYELVEVVLLAARSLEALGRPWALDISHMALVASALTSVAEDRRQEALNCLTHKNLHQLKGLCRAEAWEKLGVLAACRGGGEVLSSLEGLLTTREEQESLALLKRLWRTLEDQGLSGRVRIDFSVANDLGYYSGLVFRGYVEGIPSCLLSGGQYDALARKLGKSSRAIGFGVYLDALEEPGASQALDTLILHDGSVPPWVLAKAAGEEGGSVLVSRTLPKDRSWKRLRRFEKGEERT